ncbi:MAG: hypothetical protein ACTHY8_01050 [Microbacterium gubbeenense]|uniref:hypothetical protein n=1 Tax=Microbacterium gubbeenense TaxID=159896 RepID=UPI00041EF791|nr:hypothetical protein [Microbacterium gubbeenense]
MAPSALIAGSPLSIAELTAATLDGDLARVSRTAYASTALPDSVGLRASAAREFVPDGYAATWTTAAWIHGALEREPDPHHAHILEGSPAKRHWRGGLVAHSWPLPLIDVAVIAGTPVSTFERTCYDVARESIEDPSSADASLALAGFLALAERRADVLAWLAQGRRLKFTKQVAEILTTR